ncbi:MAG: hypothetical protein ABI986_03655, partial [Chloroflexota bacterium]
LLAIVISIPGWWTFFLPIVLVPLPIRILTRDFHFYRVRFAVLTLPLILFLSWLFFVTYNVLNITFGIILLVSFLFTPIFLLLLSSKGMRLWGKPSASAPRFARPYLPELKQLPTPVPFFIEYAPEDKKYAEAISAGLTKFGHPQVAGPGEAQASFVIISRYKNSTSIDAQKDVVYPVLIQDTNTEDPTIQRIQWIDFRGGIRNLNQMAELLPTPEKLLSALGVAPISGQVMYPRIIQMIDYALVLLAFFSVSAWIPMMAELGKQFLQLDSRVVFFVSNFIFSALTLRIIFTARRRLIHREGRLRGLVASFFWIGMIVFVQSFYILALMNTVTALAGPVINGMEDMRGSVSMFMPCSCTLGVMLIGFFSIWNWADLTRWFPSK